MHPGRPTINIECVAQMFGDNDDENIRLQDEKHMTPQKQYVPIEEDSNDITRKKGSREDAASRYVFALLTVTAICVLFVRFAIYF